MRLIISLLLVLSLMGCSVETEGHQEISIPFETYYSDGFTLTNMGTLLNSGDNYSIPLSYEAKTLYDTEFSYKYSINGSDYSNYQGYGLLRQTEDLNILVPSEPNVSTIDLDLEFRVYTSSMGDGYHIINVPISINLT